MSGAIFSQDEDPGYPAPQALREGFKSRYVAPVDMPVSTRCWHIQLPDDPQVESALHEILGILRGAAVWNGVNAEATAAFISNTLHEECELPPMNTLKFSIAPGSQDEAQSSTYDFTSLLASGSRNFPANYGFRDGTMLTMEGVFRATTEAASRQYNFRPQLGGVNLTTITVTVPEGIKVFKLNIDLMATGTQQISAVIQGVIRLTEYSDAGAQLAHYIRYGSAQLNQTQAHNFNLIGWWNGSPGGDESVMETRYGYLEIKRVE